MDKEKVINFPKEEKVTQEDIIELKNILGSVIGEGNADFNMMDSIGALLGMPEEQFRFLAPGILQSYKQSLNNPNDKIALVQALNASGGKAEDISNGFMIIIESIDNTEGVSRQKKDFLKEMMGAICNAIVDTEGIAKRIISIPIELCHENAKIPQYANISDSGMDVYALEDITIHPGETKLVATGIKIALPPGYELQVRPKSGRALKTKLRVANTPGTIDAGYRDEIKVIIENVEPPIKQLEYDFDEETHRPIILGIEHGSDFFIGKGEKFAQLVLMEVPKAAFYRVDNVLEIGENRGGGFGSSGLK